MQVNPSDNSDLIRELPSRRRVQPRTVEPEEAPFARTHRLSQALDQTPEVRPAEVQRGQALVDQAIWPPPETIRRIANLLAVHFDHDDP